MPCSEWKDFAAPLAQLAATVVAAVAVIVTGYFARQQSRIAHDQLRYNLFNKRYSIYEEIENFTSDVLRRTLPSEGSDDGLNLRRGKLSLKLGEARFFFPEQTCVWIMLMTGKWEDVLKADLDGRITVDRRVELSKMLSDMPKRFENDLSFRQLERW